MLMRHGERYPDYEDFGSDYEAILAEMASNVTTWKGDLAFLNDWTYYVEDAALYSEETTTGPYAGLLDAFSRGSEYRLRYGHLWDGKSVVPVFSSGYERVIETARYFGQGFFGYNYSTSAALNIISESTSQGADSLTPSCEADDSLYACYESVVTSLPPMDVAAARFNAQNPGLNLTGSDVTTLMQMAIFELNVRAYSPWMEAFTLDEWVAMGHIIDLLYYYCFGAHDNNITPVVAALGIDVPANPLPNDTVPFPSPYRAADIVPMGGHLTFERLTCNATAASPAGVYVRVVLNEAVVPLNLCQSGPGYSCPLANYSAIIDNIPKFDETCNTTASSPQYLDFFWNYNTSTQYNYQNGPIGYQFTDTTV
ncbi:acid phosphatase pho5 [Sporothrix bragantina]|uniref:Acid phosphatase pho5 n=1 Tax=Sporothrix bragantina TaxID=671064 RepID=A0ABP0B515_9PEZI